MIADAEAAGYAREPSMPDAYEDHLHRDAQEAAEYLAIQQAGRDVAA